MRLLITIASFAYPNAKFNAMGNTYVNYNELEQLTALGSLQGAADHVANRYYPIKNLEKMSDIEQKIFGAELKYFKDALETVPKVLKPLVKCYLLKWECRYLKSVLSEKVITHKGRLEPVLGMPDIDLDSDLWLKLKTAPSMNEVLTILTNTRYHEKLKKAMERSRTDFTELDQILDEIFYHELNSLKSRLPRSISKPAADFINLTNDVTNVKVLLRSKYIGLDEVRINKLLLPPGKQLADWKLTELSSTRSVPELVQNLEGTDYYNPLEKMLKNYSRTGDILALELALDRYYLNEIINLSLESSLTVGPTIRFIISKEFETRNLISVLRGLEKQVHSENILALTVHEQQASQI